MYDLVLFIHILAGISIFVSLTFEGLLLGNLRRARSESEISGSLGQFSILPWIGASSTLVTLLTGMYMATVASLWESGWPVVSLLGLVLLAVYGIIFGSRPAQTAEKLVRTGKPLPPGLRSALQAPRLLRSVWGRTFIGAGIVYLMAIEPNRTTSFMVLGISLALALLVLVAPARRPAVA